MAEVFLALGSNLGDRANQLKTATKEIEKIIGRVLLVSSIYESKAWGFEGCDFLNSVLKVETELKPKALLHAIGRIEESMGRERTGKSGYENRSIDIDILFYGNERVNSDKLTIPHPEIANRLFVLQPLAEIAPKHLHPSYLKTIQQLLEQCKDKTKVTVYCH